MEKFIKIAGRNIRGGKNILSIIKTYDRYGKIKFVYTDTDNKLESVENIINFEVKNANKANNLITKFKKMGYVKFMLERDSSGKKYATKVTQELYI